MQIKINMKKPTNKQITETLNLNSFTIVCTAPPLPPISAGTWLNLLSDFQKGGALTGHKLLLGFLGKRGGMTFFKRVAVFT